jgi:predicted metal-binding membrane protein
LIAFGLLLGGERLLALSMEGARWLGVVLFALAGLYQFTPWKDACLSHCRSPLMQLLQYGAYRGRARDLRVGFHHGAHCVGCCWGLMVVLVAVGVMNVAAMAGLAAVIFLEKLWRYGFALSRAVGLALLGMAAAAIFTPDLMPALQGSGMG